PRPPWLHRRPDRHLDRLLTKSYGHITLYLAFSRGVDGDLNAAAHEIVSRAILSRVDVLFAHLYQLWCPDLELAVFVLTSLEDHEASLDRGAGVHIAESNTVGLNLSTPRLRTDSLGAKHQDQDGERERPHGVLRERREMLMKPVPIDDSLS